VVKFNGCNQGNKMTDLLNRLQNLPPNKKELLLRKLIRLLISILADMRGQQTPPVIELARSVLDTEALTTVMLLNDPQHAYALCLNCRLD